MWADVPRDLAFFIVGLLAYRHGWLLKFPTRAGMAWLGVGVAWLPSGTPMTWG